MSADAGPARARRERATVSPWWMLLPALYFGATFVASQLIAAPERRTPAVYDETQIVGTIVQDLIFVAYALFAVRMSGASARAALALRRTRLGPAVRAGLLALVAIVVANIVVDQFVNASKEQGIAPQHAPRSEHQWVLLGIAAVALVLVAPFAEEIVFRGLGFAAFGRVALPLTAALFAVAHLLVVLLVPIFVFGLVIGWVRRRTGSIWPGMAIHMSVNALSLALALSTT
jgi:membrane protease YdiL (CAAX protease family)